MTTATANSTDQIRDALDVLCEARAVVELRILNTRQGTVSGYYTDRDALARDAARWSGRATGLYVTLNPVTPDLLARSANRLTAYARHTTTDNDITSRRWLPVDCDPRRPAGISATDGEHAAALERAGAICDYLARRGWPAPVLADSGNGAHLLYRVVLSNDPVSTTMIDRCLQALALRFGDDAVSVDVSTYNAARIWKLYGTLAAKGDSLPDRPHRQAQLLDVPGGLTAVPLALLDQLSEEVPDEPQQSGRARTAADRLDVNAYLSLHGIDVRGRGDWNGGHKWVLASCPWNPDHTDRSAYVVQFASGAVAAGCHHNGCSGKGWHDLRDAVEPGWRGRGSWGATDSVGGTTPDHDAEADWPPRQPLPPAMPSVPSLPAAMIPEALRPWLVDIAERASMPLEMPAIPAIVGLGAVVGRRIGIRPGRYDDFLVVPNLWGALVLRPGSMKTSAIAEGLKPLHRLAATARDRYADELDRVGARAERIKAEADALKEAMKKVAGGKEAGDLDDLERRYATKMAELRDSAVTERRYLTNDPTVEKLGELLRQNPRGLLVSRDELAGWLKTLEKTGREGDREFYLEAWNGDGSYTFDRIGRGTLHIPAVTVSIVGGIQPGKLRTYIRDALGESTGADGLLQRFQLLVWPDGLGTWKPANRWPDKAARDTAYAIYRALDELDPRAVGAEIEPESIPYLRFDPRAQALYDSWRDDLERRLRSDELARFPAFESHIAKYRSLLPSLALLFHLAVLVDIGYAGPVTEAAFRQAAAWCDYLELHARKVYYAELYSDSDAAHLLAEKIKAGKINDGQSVRDIYRAEWSGLTSADRVHSALELLAGAGWVRTEMLDTRGRASEVVRLHPELKGSRHD